MLNILYNNNQLIAFSKPPGIPVQADKTGDPTFQQQAEAYCKHPLQLVHRIDRPVSGLVLFAKNKPAMTNLSRQFQARTVEKTYLALVAEMPPQPEGELVHFLKKNEKKNISVVVPETEPGAEKAEMHYKVLGSSERYHLLLIQLHTGRHHQIRAQLAAIGCPVRGDAKYGFKRGNRDRSIQLHAWRLTFDHPVTDDRVKLEAPLPEDAVWKAFEGMY